MNITISLSEAVAFGFAIIIMFVYGFVALMTWIKQARCKHDGGVNETSACHAICRKCLKDLGFIGTWREKQKASTS